MEKSVHDLTKKKVMTKTTVETTIILFNVKLKYQEFNLILSINNFSLTKMNFLITC